MLKLILNPTYVFDSLTGLSNDFCPPVALTMRPMNRSRTHLSYYDKIVSIRLCDYCHGESILNT